MSLEGKYAENGRCVICGENWPHIHTLEEVFLFEARLFSSGMLAARDEALARQRSRIRGELLEEVKKAEYRPFRTSRPHVTSSRLRHILDRVCPEEG